MIKMMKSLLVLALLSLPVSGQRRNMELENADRKLNCGNDTHDGEAPAMDYNMAPSFSGGTAMPTPTAFGSLNAGMPFPAPPSQITTGNSPSMGYPTTSAPSVFNAGDRGFTPTRIPTLAPTSSPVTTPTTSSPTTERPTMPVAIPVATPVAVPTPVPTKAPTIAPTKAPTVAPVAAAVPVTAAPVSVTTPSPVQATKSPTKAPTPAPVVPVTAAPVVPPTPAPVVPATPAPVVTAPAPVAILLPQNDDVAPPVNIPTDDCFDCFDFITPVGTPGGKAAASSPPPPPENIEAQSSAGLGAAPLVGVAVGGVLVIAGVVLAGRNRWSKKQQQRMAAMSMESDPEDIFEPNSPMSAQDSLARDGYSPRDRFRSERAEQDVTA